MDLTRRIVLMFLKQIESQSFRDNIIDYLTDNLQEQVDEGERTSEELEARKLELIDELDSLREEVAERMISRSKRYIMLSSLILSIGVLFVWYWDYLTVVQLGAIIGLSGSIILGLAIIRDTYSLFGMIVATGWGSPRKYFKLSLIDDTVDGLWGVSYLIIGFSLQIF